MAGYLDTPTRSRRLASGGGSRTKVELHQVDVQLQKEIDRLEREQSAAVNNIANHQQVMKMSWRKLEQRRTAESPLLASSKDAKASASPSPRRGIFYSNTKLSANVNVWKEPEEPAPPTSTLVTVTGDVHHRRLHRGPPPSSSNRVKSSPYLSSPYSMRRSNINPVPRPSSFSTDERGNTPDLEGSQTKLNTSTSSANSHVIRASTDTTDKNTLLKASVLMGVEPSSHGPQSFKDFYSRSTGGERSPSASAVSILQVSSASPEDHTEEELESSKKDDEPSTQSSDGPTMAQMFDQIKHCRYIRRYHPDGTALEEY